MSDLNLELFQDAVGASSTCTSKSQRELRKYIPNLKAQLTRDEIQEISQINNQKALEKWKKVTAVYCILMSAKNKKDTPKWKERPDFTVSEILGFLNSGTIKCSNYSLNFINNRNITDFPVVNYNICEKTLDLCFEFNVFKSLVDSVPLNIKIIEFKTEEDYDHYYNCDNEDDRRHKSEIMYVYTKDCVSNLKYYFKNEECYKTIIYIMDCNAIHCETLEI